MSENRDTPYIDISGNGSSDANVELFLKLDATNPKRLVSRESSRLEYKQNFNWASRAKYAKTMAAFANNIGGFIVFGVKDSPHELVGLTSDRFEKQDPARVTEYLNSKFAPELDWSWYSVNIGDTNLGVVSVEPAREKPVICIGSDGSDLREADIYYRYRGRSERIRLGELQRLIAEKQKRERETFLKHLRKIVRVGPENIGVLDLISGELSGQRRSMLISDDLVGKLQFIREGGFKTNDETGMPTLHVVGDTKIVASDSLLPIRTVVSPKAIGPKDLILGFLHQESPQAPIEYLRQACRENSPNMPVYHFVRLAGLSLAQMKSMVLEETPNRNQLLRRLEGKLVRPFGSLSGDTEASAKRTMILNILEEDANFEKVQAYDPILLFEAVSHYVPISPPHSLMRTLANLVIDQFDRMNSSQRTGVRKAVAHLDEVLNRARCKEDLE